MSNIRIATALLFLTTATASAASNDCNRKCLDTLTHRFLNALVKHSPADAELADNFRYTENAIRTATSEGLWKTSSGLGQLQRVYVDPVQSQSIFFGLIEEGGQPAIASLRLKVVNGK